jgi:uncharacterized membrane protein
MQDGLLIIHFLGLALGLGTSFAMLRLGLALKHLAPAERAGVMKHALSLSKNGSLGLALLILSGLALLFTRGAATVFASGGGAFHAKLTLVVLLSAAVGYSQVLVKRMREKQDQAAMGTMAKLGPVMLLLSVGAVICAVIAFH